MPARLAHPSKILKAALWTPFCDSPSVKTGVCPRCGEELGEPPHTGAAVRCPRCGRRLRARWRALKLLEHPPDDCQIELHDGTLQIVASNNMGIWNISEYRVADIISTLIALVLLYVLFFELSIIPVRVAVLAGILAACAGYLLVMAIGRVEIDITPERVRIVSGFPPLAWRTTIPRESIRSVKICAGLPGTNMRTWDDYEQRVGGMLAAIEIRTEEGPIRFGRALSDGASWWVAATLAEQLKVDLHRTEYTSIRLPKA